MTDSRDLRARLEELQAALRAESAPAADPEIADLRAQLAVLDEERHAVQAKQQPMRLNLTALQTGAPSGLAVSVFVGLALVIALTQAVPTRWEAVVTGLVTALALAAGLTWRYFARKALAFDANDAGHE